MHALKGILLGIAVVGIGALFLYSKAKPANKETAAENRVGRSVPGTKRPPVQPGQLTFKGVPPASWGKDDPRIEGPRNPSAEWVQKQLDLPQYRGRLPFIPHAGMKVPTQAEMDAYRTKMEQAARAFSPETERDRYKTNR